MPVRLRPFSSDDVEAVLAVILARDVVDIGASDFTIEDLHADWASPGLALEHDARVLARSGHIRGYAVLLGDDAVVLVHPSAEGRGDGTVLRRWAEARAAERGTTVLRQFTYGTNEAAREHLHAAGYAPAQHYFRLRADLADVPPGPAVALRTFDVERDEAAVHALIQDAFADVEGHEFQSLDRWRSKSIAKEGHDPALWLLLEDE